MYETSTLEDFVVPPPDPRASANAAGLVYVSTDQPGLTRRRAGRGFRYLDAAGERVADKAAVSRIRRLAIPPAWREVWICADPNGHLQATGYDEKGRRQYRYHPDFRAVREATKFEHMLDFARALPALRARVDADLKRGGRDRRAVLACVVRLLEATMIRVGGAAYARQNGSFGLTTLRRRHVQLEGAQLHFHFKGKSGRTWRLNHRDRRVARVVRACQDLPGQHLFQYLDEHGDPQNVTSNDVNAYLKAVTGRDITAKDFRTWNGTVLAASALAVEAACEAPAARKRAFNRAIAGVAARLGNTVAVCRQCYVHPVVGDAYLCGALTLDAEAAVPGLDPDEAAVLAFLSSRTPNHGLAQPAAG
jgi:DNA topoisomerase-1